jgi:hypothetical protein
MKLYGPQSLDAMEKRKNLLLLLPEIQVRFSDHPALSLVTILTNLFRLPVAFAFK